MKDYVIVRNSDMHKSGDNDTALVKVDEQLKLKLTVAQKVFDALVDDGFYGEYALGEDLWNEFQAAFK